MSKTQYLKLKKNLLTYYSLSDEKRYNDKSKENLVQNKTPVCPELAKELKRLKNQKEVMSINEYSKHFLTTYENANGYPFKRTFSRTQQKKISDSTNTFIDVVKYNYRKSKGFNQRMITFVTLTLPENQKHTDKVLIKTLVDFIDHLKKVKNTLIQNKEDTGIELLKLQNYVWRAETTEAGNLHFHLLFDTYVNHTTLKRVWNNYLKKLGYNNGDNAANIHNLKNIDDVGGYVTKYLTKEPLNDEFNDLLKNGQITRDDLRNYDDDIKYRRPILYTAWGCSKSLKKLTSPTFSGGDVRKFDELKNKCVPVELPEDLRGFIKIYKGKIYKLLNDCSKQLKNIVKSKFKILYSWLYEKTDSEKEFLEELKYINSLRKPIFEVVTENSKPIQKPKLIIPNLF